MTTSPHFSIAIDPRPTSQHVRVELRGADPVAALSPDQVTFFAEQWASVARAAQWGLLVDPAVPPAKAAGRVLGHGPLLPNSLAVELEVHGVGLAGWRVALQLMMTLSESTAALASVSISSIPAAKPLTVASVLATPYAAARQAPFSVTREEGDAQRDRRILLQFAGDLGQAQRTEVEQAFAGWMDLVNGGFPAPGESPFDNACDATDVDWLDDATAECAIPSYLGDEAAFDAIVSMAVVMDTKLARVAALEID